MAGGDAFEDWPAIEAGVEQLLKREVLTPQDFYAVSASARAQAFTISGDLTVATIDQVRALLGENLEGPAGRRRFMAEAREKVAALPISDAHLEHVYRNAVNTAYSLGMEDVLSSPLVGEAFPYRAWYAIRDDRVRPDHLAMETQGIDGTNIYNAADPVWLELRPPFSWACRCGWVAMSVESAAEDGLKEAIEWQRSGVPPQAFTFVPWPKYDGEEIHPPPSWRRL